MSYKKVVPRNFAKFTGKHLCQSLFFNKVAAFLGLLIELLNSIAHAVLHWYELIPFYQRMTKIIFKICFSRSCSPSQATKQIYFWNFTHPQTHFGHPKSRASVTLHQWEYIYQGSVLSPFFFIIVMEALSHDFRTGCPWELLYANDLVIVAESLGELKVRLKNWKGRTKEKELKVSLLLVEISVIVQCIHL